MYIESIKYQEKEGSKWKKGFYIGKNIYHEPCEKFIILDENYKPVPKNTDGYQVWDFLPDINKNIIICFEE